MKRLFYFFAFLLFCLPIGANVQIDGVYYVLEGDSAKVVFGEEYKLVDTIRVPQNVAYEGKKYRVTTIGYGAFSSCSNVVFISISDGVSMIEPQAFADCVSLTDVVLPNTLISIGSSAFSNCVKLKKITIPNSVLKLGDNAFGECRSLKTVELSTALQTLEESLFYADSALTSVAIPPSVKTIGAAAFYECNGLTSISIPEGVLLVDGGAFYGCRGLVSAFVPSTVTSLASDAFLDCGRLKSISVGAENKHYKSIDGVLYNYGGDSLICCPAGRTDMVSISDAVKVIGKDAFFDCCAMSGVLSIPPSVAEIGAEAFYNCKSLGAFDVKEGNSRYASSDGLLYNKALDTLICCPMAKADTVNIPLSARVLNTSLLEICPLLKAFVVENGNISFKSSDGILYNYAMDTLICCPKGKSGKAVLAESLKVINSGAFYGCAALTDTIFIPKSVVFIGMGAFGKCRMLSEIAVDESNTNYSSYDGLLYNKAMDTLIVCPLNRQGSVHFPKSVRYVRHSVFDKCVGLQEAVVDEDNVNLKSVDGILYNYAVDTLIYCPIGRSRGVKLPLSVKVITNSAFKDCQLMDDIVLDSALTQIRGLVFSGCTSLSTMTLPCLVNFVGYGAFLGCKNLKSIVCKAVTPPDYGDLSVFDSSAVKNLCVPCASVSAYSVSDLWKEIASIRAIDDLDCGSAVVDAMVSNATVYTQGRKIIVVFDDSRRSGDAISSVSIYDIEGGLIYRSKRGDVDFDTPSSGVYVVKVGKESKKVLIQ